MMWPSLAASTHAERITTLIDVPLGQRDVGWLQAALQAAVCVELSTIPPYLCALWSIKDEMHPVAASIRNVVQEEMLHMSLACNMLTAIGGTPAIASASAVPRYWAHLPVGIHPDLTVVLTGYNESSLATFIEIEAPDPTPDERDGQHRSIGDFYTGVAETLTHVAPQISLERQVAGPLAFMTIPTLESAYAAIDLIKDQGEGSSAATVAHTDELAHYYRFLELRERRHLSHLDEGGAPVFDGPVWDEPETWPVATVPDGGHQRADVPPSVWDQLDRFDRTFSRLLDSLQLAWETGRETPLVRGIEIMFELTTLGRSVMQIDKPDGSGTYCPSFRRV